MPGYSGDNNKKEKKGHISCRKMQGTLIFCGWMGTLAFHYSGQYVKREFRNSTA